MNMKEKEKINFITLGICLGTSFGVVFNNIPIGIVIGILGGFVLNNLKK
ncbi:hypothetical protein [Alkaliphilus hydrothermalis]|uniref:MFS superfamily sulfate permease-like transporter n=1 Tax=Alkaliphilus hydrothermalis TaxID=1482730 RepID=A0ABS2NTX6_9FIRM|nr:hypothetical protein [Alkaliphilus hydrothermalis]MBM7616029.1 MFS superfamily sulfate permease-like transporter [Alkaliphilus hydrothermalis]